MAHKGELYHYLEVRGDVAAPWGVTTAWDSVQEVAWYWLWNRRDETAIRVRLLGMTIYRLRFRHLTLIWRRLFGDCPFSWEEGPRA